MTHAATFGAKNVAYTTPAGAQIVGDSRELLRKMPEASVDLIVTSPPFALLRKKAYGNEDQHEYVNWLSEFGKLAMPVLRETGSLVIDLGGAYQRGVPVRSLYNYRVLLEFVDNLGYHLAEEFFWFNPSKLPSPIEWVNKRKIRATDAVNTVWWLSKSEFPKADVRNVLTEYSDKMKQLLRDPAKYYDAADRPSQHSIGRTFDRDNGGAIPKNLLQIPNTESNSFYLRTCRELGLRSHPARFPADLPRFFIEFLTEKDDVVLDIFSGSNTTGHVAEGLERKWLAFEMDREYAALSAVRFLEGRSVAEVRRIYERIARGGGRVTISSK